MDKRRMKLMGQRIESLRGPMSQEDLAGLLSKEVKRLSPGEPDVPRSAISMWENGQHKPEYIRLIGLAEVFETTIGYLVGITDDPSPPRHTLTPAPELWDLVRHANKQPAYMRRLLAQMYEAARNYAQELAASLGQPETPGRDADAAQAPDAQAGPRADAALLSSLATELQHSAADLQDLLVDADAEVVPNDDDELQGGGPQSEP